jgi:hypothetical protein
MKKLVTILLAVLMTAAYSATTITGGEVSGTWNAAGSPYNIQGEILVPDGQTLTLDGSSGPVVIDFQGHYKLNVQGEMSTSGTDATNTITFTRSDDQTTGWGGIRFIHSDQGTNSTSALNYIVVEYGKANGTDLDNYGGGIFINPSSQVTIANSTIQNCTAAYDGGGIYTTSTYSGASITGTKVINCTALGDGNTDGNGGGIYVGLNSNIDLIGLQLSGNTATPSTYGGNGGGLYLYKTDPGTDVKSVAVYGNSAKNGGGIFSYSSTVEYVNLTVADNSATNNGGGIAVYKTGHELVTASIFWGNSASGSGTQWHETEDLSSTNDFRFDYCMIQGGQFGTNAIVAVDPVFDSAGTYPYALSQTSPSSLIDIDFGDPAAVAAISGDSGALAAGFDWGATAQDFNIVVNGSTAQNIGLNSTTANDPAVITELEEELLADANITLVGAEAGVGANTVRFNSNYAGANISFILSAGTTDALAGGLGGLVAGTFTGTVGYGTIDAAGQDREIEATTGNDHPDIGAYEYQSALPSTNKPNFTITTAVATGDVDLSGGGIDYSSANEFVKFSYDNGSVVDITLDDDCTDASDDETEVAAEWNTKLDASATGDVVDVAADVTVGDFVEITEGTGGSHYFRIYEPHQQSTNGLVGVGIDAGTYSGTNATTAGVNGTLAIHCYEGEQLTILFAGTDADTEPVVTSASTGYDTGLGMLFTPAAAGNSTTGVFTWTPSYDTTDETTGTQDFTVEIDLAESTGIYNQKVTYTLNITVHDKDQVLAPATTTPATNASTSPISIPKDTAYPITFNGIDPDGKTLDYTWYEGEDVPGLVEITGEESATYNYPAATLGARVVRLVVTDNYGGTKDQLTFTWYFQVLPAGWTAVNTGNNMTFIIEQEDLGTTPAITSGDYIAAFYDDNGVEKCAGYVIIPNPVADVALTIWGDDTGTADKDGFDIDEPIKLKLYDVSGPSFYNVNVVAYQDPTTSTLVTDNDGLYGIDDVEAPNLNSLAGDLSLQLILDVMMPLRAGWGIISSYVDFDSPSMSNIFSSVSDKLIIAKNNAGDIYSPIYNVDQISTWDITEGYKVKMVSADSVSAVGVRVALSTGLGTGQQIPVAEGWNIFPFYGQVGDDLDDMFNSGVVGDGSNGNVVVSAGGLDLSGAVDNDLELMKDQDGLVWVPGSIVDLDSMKTWEGYQVYVDAYGGGDTFEYCSTTTKDGSMFTNVNNYIAELPTPKVVKSLHWNSSINTGNNATVIVLEAALADKVAPGDEVAAFDTDGNYVGSVLYTGGNLGLTIWGDDEMTTPVDGLEVSEQYELRVYKAAEFAEYTLGNVEFQKGSDKYDVDGINIVAEIGTMNLYSSIGEIVPEKTALFQNYPNPFNPTTTINFDLSTNSFVKIAVYNYSGQLVKDLVRGNLNAGSLSVTWDGTDNSGSQVAAGVYFYKMQTEKFTSVKKAVMVK